MLRSLSIQNYVLIESLHLDFTHGFSVITGETGAGKSILLGAIGLLVGNRADSTAIRSGATKCTIEGVFDVGTLALQSFFDANDLEYDDTCIVRRELLATGKSRAFINDTPVSLAQLKALGGRLIDIHSQHQNLLLGAEGFQMGILDTMADDAAERDRYHTAYRAYRQADEALRQAEADHERNTADEEYLRFQLAQFEEAQLQEGEEEELEEEQALLSHAEEIKAGLYEVTASIDNEESSLLTALKSCRSTLEGLATHYTQATEWAERIGSAYIELKDIVSETADAAESIAFDPQRLEDIEERLSLIYKLEQKHRVQTVSELLAIEHSLHERLAAVDNGAEHIEELRAAAAEARTAMLTAARALTECRQRAATPTEEAVVSRLRELGMPGIRFKVDISPRREAAEEGMDTVTFLFSANKSTVLQDIADVASGGEIARVMLTIKAITATARQLPTILFDEIDTGVSGSIADRMADIMKEMADNGHQIISITHLPQIAAKGATHYKVSKQETATGTISTLTPLTYEERITEIASMMSGSDLTEAAINNAKALLGSEPIQHD